MLDKIDFDITVHKLYDIELLEEFNPRLIHFWQEDFKFSIEEDESVKLNL